VHCIDRSLNRIQPENAAQYAPDLIVTLAVRSFEAHQTFLRSSAGVQTIRVGNDFPFMDTFQSLIFTTSVDPAAFVTTLHNATAGGPRIAVRSGMEATGFQSGMVHTDYLKTVPFSDLKAMEIVLDVVPENAQLHIGNSSIIRYACCLTGEKHPLLVQPRTSGIDGSSSTLAGSTDGTAELARTGFRRYVVLLRFECILDKPQPANLRIFVLNNAAAISSTSFRGRTQPRRKTGIL